MATTHFQDAAIVADVSKNIGVAMVGIHVHDIPSTELLASRGW